jgi:phosphoribosylamine--glycine ligase
MKILVVGSGGREHAIVWKLAQSNKISKIYCAPGNGGISQIAMCVSIKVMDIPKMVQFAYDNKIDLVVVASDDPLAAGMIDAMEEKGIKAFGPRKNAAIIEASKIFSKDLMKKYNIPTAQFESFDESDKALSYLNKCNFPIVVKVDGLALGKGVVIAYNYEEARDAVLKMMEEKQFGDSGNKIVIEEYLEGFEVSILAFTDGKSIVPMVSSKDHKRAFDNDQGPNTGGMGTISPNPYYTPEIAQRCMDEIYIPTINAMNSEGRKFKGVLYFGLMLTENGPKTLEYNARFGDPETQVVLPRLNTDLVEIMNAVIDERLADIKIEWSDKEAVCVIAASGGYPGDYSIGFEIQGIKNFIANDIYIFHSGTKYKNCAFYTSGGRVFGVTAIAEDVEKAAVKAYDAIKNINFKNIQYRKDIGLKSGG